MQRREIARAEMAQFEGLGKFMYLLHSPYVRKLRLPDKTVVHSAIDVIGILSDSENEPRKLWNDTKKRLLKQDEDMSEKIGHIALPLWNDTKKRLRPTDVMTSSGLVILVFELHTKTSNKVRHGIAGVFDRYASEHHEAILAELERTTGWAGTRIRLEMQEIYEPGDYDNPVQPPGCPE
jgi:hypothetical protein